METVETARLLLRRPQRSDAQAIFERYGSDVEVTRYLGWSRHESLKDTRRFLDFSDEQWERWPAGPYLIESRADRRLLGSTGLGFETPECAATGYVLARDSWGQGFATEALTAMVELATQLKARRLYALCHKEHRASLHVLEKSGFQNEGAHRQNTGFPNLGIRAPAEVMVFAKALNREVGP
jgi:ribosomal-protein-alanine N-acetyltransferase